LLLRANHEDKKVLIESTLVECKRGELITSLYALAKDWGVSRDVVRHFLQLLESDNMIVRKAATKYTQITICNYASYQDVPTTNSLQTHDNSTTNSLQTHPNNNYNNDNNINILSKESNGEASGEAPKRTQKGVKRKAFTPPTLEQVEQFCKENNLRVNAQKFFYHYESNGWMAGRVKMKPWEATLQKWNNSEYDNSNSTPARPENNPLANQQWRDPSRTEKWDFESSTDFD
jgi:DNA-binding transcriptional regulator YhcF (GntR family)